MKWGPLTSPSSPGPQPGADGDADGDDRPGELEPVLEFREKHRARVICNEFGTYVRATRRHQLLWVRDLLSVLQNADLGFSYWTYKNLDFGIISQGESLHRDLHQYHNKDRVDSELLALLRQH